MAGLPGQVILVHTVQFFDDETLLAETVGGFLRQGVRESGGALCIARARHRAALERAAGPGVTWHEAEATLARFMVDGWPDEARFRAAIQPELDALRAVARAHGGTPMPRRAYGEMVAVLAEGGQAAAALELERMWNRLLDGQAVDLLCAYPNDAFAQEHGHRFYLGVCACHAGQAAAEPHSVPVRRVLMA